MMRLMRSMPPTKPATARRASAGRPWARGRSTTEDRPVAAGARERRAAEAADEACEELDGSPSHQVRRPQIWPTGARRGWVIVTAFVSTRPLPMVFATAVPASAPRRFQKEAQATASRGVRTFVDTTVAMAFAVSWKPLMY
jgi:hypothetical protein